MYKVCQNDVMKYWHFGRSKTCINITHVQGYTQRNWGMEGHGGIRRWEHTSSGWVPRLSSTECLVLGIQRRSTPAQRQHPAGPPPWWDAGESAGSGSLRVLRHNKKDSREKVSCRQCCWVIYYWVIHHCNQTTLLILEYCNGFIVAKPVIIS